MSLSSNSRCLVQSCKTTSYNKGPVVQLHPCPTSDEMRLKWMKVLKNRCFMLDWNKNKICSKHFEHKCFDSQRKLKDNAVPTLFNKDVQNISKVDTLLSKVTQSELTADVKATLTRMKEPSNLDVFVRDDLTCKPDAPTEAKLWLLVKKQENLNTRLLELVTQPKNHADRLETKMQEYRYVKNDEEQSVDSLKYIIKCLQEKHATLEEQIEILTAIENR